MKNNLTKQELRDKMESVLTPQVKADELACSLLHGVDFATEADMIKAIASVSQYIQSAILTELMEPIREEEIYSQAHKTYHKDDISAAVFADGARWAATRNLKVGLEGLKEYMMWNNSAKGVPVYLKSDIEKLIGK